MIRQWCRFYRKSAANENRDNQYVYPPVIIAVCVDTISASMLALENLPLHLVSALVAVLLI